MTTQSLGPRIIVALDFDNEASAMNLVEQLSPESCRLKVGKEMFTRLGPQFVEKLAAKGFDIFLDLKFYDIPNTVAGACASAADLGVWMVNVHASGGRKMMETAKNRLEQLETAPLLIAVTILTSMGQEDITEIGFSGTPQDNVVRFAKLTQDCGLDGVVCSPLEVAAIRETIGQDFQLVTPGVRPATASMDDQTRVMTPSDALTAGSSYLVIGRPITAAPDPMASLQAIQADISAWH
jgi:orotidine-5'-phosphate decarboxylase